jgi:hypothetical protein
MLLTASTSANTSVEPALQRATASLQVALRLHLGLRMPQLVRLLQALLGVHQAWLRQERWNTDPFKGLLRLSELRQAGGGGVARATDGPSEGPSGAGAQQQPADGSPSWVAPPDGGAGSEGHGGGGGEMLSDSDGDDGGVDEESILRLMEILEVPRSTSIDLLFQHDGDVEAALMSALG